MFFSKIHPARHSDANGIKPGSNQKTMVREGPFEFLGGGGGGALVIFGETVFFFSSAGKPGYFFPTG